MNEQEKAIYEAGINIGYMQGLTLGLKIAAIGSTIIACVAIIAIKNI